MGNFSTLFKDADSYYEESFRRNIGILTPEEQITLRSLRVAIVGMGGVGGFHLINLVRMGIGGFNIADMDCYEPANFQRQCGAFMDTVGKNKAQTMADTALDRKSTRLNSSHTDISRMPSSA